MGMQSGTSGWTVTLHRDAPLDVTGYTSMRLALYFEEIPSGTRTGFYFMSTPPHPNPGLTADRETGGVEFRRADRRDPLRRV